MYSQLTLLKGFTQSTTADRIHNFLSGLKI